MFPFSIFHGHLICIKKQKCIRNCEKKHKYKNKCGGNKTENKYINNLYI